MKGDIQYLFEMIDIKVEFACHNNDIIISSGKKNIGRIVDTNNIKSKLFTKHQGLFLAEFNLDIIDKIISKS